MHGLLEPRRGLAGWRGQRDQRQRPAGGEPLLLEQRDDPGHRRGLAGARSAGNDREPAQDRRGGGETLPAVEPGREQTGQPSASTSADDGVHRCRSDRLEVGGELALLAPVAVEVQRRADEAQRPRLPVTLSP